MGKIEYLFMGLITVGCFTVYQIVFQDMWLGQFENPGLFEAFAGNVIVWVFGITLGFTLIRLMRHSWEREEA